MIDQDKVDEAITEFMANPTWKQVFTNAPGGAMERLAIAFYFSKFNDQFKPEDFQEYRALRDEYEKSLTEEDLQYLIENNDKPDAKKHYEELLSELKEKGGEPQGQMRFEKGEGEESNDGEEQMQDNEGQEPPKEEEEKVVETESEATNNVEEIEKNTSAVEELTEEKESEETGDEKKNDLTENETEPNKDEKYDTALSVALEYLQNEQKNLEGEKGVAETPKTN